jgi:ABC-type oligopeptide transport system ATPase subunit
MTDTLVEARELHKVFHAAHGRVVAVRQVSFSITTAMCVGLVGESGSGKTTTARMVVGLERPTSGHLRVDGMDPYGGSRRHARLSRSVTMIFQDPYQSLSPRMLTGRAVEYPLLIQGTPSDERTRRVHEVFDQVGLPRAAASRYPHQLSTGQRQRVGIARALITRPRLIVADEPLSSVDVSLQSQILNLLADIQRETHVAYLVISHDLAVVGQLCDYILVMQAGQVIEEGPAAGLLAAPRSEYTAKLVAAAGL